MSVDVFFKAIFFALQKPGWHPKVIDSAFRCLKIYASFKSNNFSTPNSKQRYVTSFLMNISKLVQILEGSQPPDSGPDKKRPIRLSADTLRSVLTTMNEFFMNYSLVHIADVMNVSPILRAFARFALNVLLQANNSCSKEKLNLV